MAIFEEAKLPMNTSRIFEIGSPSEFNSLALETYNFQFQKNAVYREFCTHLGKIPKQVHTVTDIPFLPIHFFKTKKIYFGEQPPEAVFTSSGTTAMSTSKHYVQNLAIYKDSFRQGIHHFYGNMEEYCILALLPSYLERQGSSLVYMVQDLISQSQHPESGFYLHNVDELAEKLQRLDDLGTKVILLGVSFALIDLATQYSLSLKNTIVMETGGMKGRRKEMIRSELHTILQSGLGVPAIHSEYGMTELLSQAYSKGKGLFKTPPWMRVLVRDTEDPFTLQPPEKSGGINVIDLANVYSCSFIATQDLGKLHREATFEILGRFDHSDIRGCNLMVL